jgi:DNA-binding response OmpR family regulator
MTTKPIICVIDDDALVRRTLCGQLESAGFQTVEAANGQEGLNLVRQTSAPVAVVDIIMPEHEGISAIKEMKRSNPDTRILAISGGGFGDARRYLEFAQALGADDTLMKPFHAQEFIDRVTKLAARP